MLRRPFRLSLKGELSEVSKQTDLKNLAVTLTNLANERGGKDNISVIVLGYDQINAPPPHPDKITAEDKEKEYFSKYHYFVN